MAFPKYIAWLDGFSVAVGTLAEVERKAREHHATENYQHWQDGRDSTLRITTYGAQKFVKQIILAAIPQEART